MSLSRIVSRRSVLQGRVLDIGVERVALPGGREVDLEIVRHPGAAAVVAITERDEVLLLRQYRHAVGETLWEIPAGTREPGEKPLVCARRELGEEASVSAKSWTDLGEMVPAPGFSSERIHLFLARDLEETGGERDPDELILEVERVPVEQVLRWVADGTITDAKSVVAICRADARGLLRAGAS